MKKYIYLLSLILCFSCNPFYKEYQELNKESLKNNLYYEQLRVTKAILSKEKNPIILIISWKKNILVKDGALYYSALIYNPLNKAKRAIMTTEKKSNEIITSDDLSNINFRELNYILDNYLQEKKDYLLSLEDSFSGAESSYPYYIYDFVKNKKLKIKSFAFDIKGNIIQ